MKTNNFKLKIVFIILVLFWFTECDFKKRTLLIRNHKTIERISIGMDINSAKNRLDRKYYVEQREIPLFDKSPAYEYVVYKSDTKEVALLSFNSGYDGNSKDEVFRIVIKNPRYKTEEGVSVGMSIKELKQKTKIKSADFNYTDGLFLISDVFDGGFLIDISGVDFSTFNFENIEVNAIPEELKVKQIIIF